MFPKSRPVVAEFDDDGCPTVGAERGSCHFGRQCNNCRKVGWVHSKDLDEAEAPPEQPLICAECADDFFD